MSDITEKKTVPYTCILPLRVLRVFEPSW